jgi:hypothetical protein
MAGGLGALLERAAYRGKRWFRASRRQLFLWARDPAFAGTVAEYRRLIEAKDWEGALPLALQIAGEAERRCDRRLLDEMIQALTRLGAFGRAAELRILRRHIVKGRRAGEWMGEDISGRTLLIDLMETEKQGLATAIRHASTVAIAARRAGRTVVVVEKRLVPLFQRTFPGVEVRAVGPEGEAAYGEAEAFAGVQHLTALFETDAATIAGNFTPLAADPAVTAALRASYRQGADLPLVGISWGSIAPGKDLPPLSAWAPLLAMTGVRFVSLQYGKVERDLATLRAGDEGRILFDPSVDQLVDMDRFAAQVAALDAVVTVSNTGAHLSGALGRKTVVLLGEGFRRSWPVNADATPYYPTAVLIGRHGQPWEAAIEKACASLKELLVAGAGRDP